MKFLFTCLAVLVCLQQIVAQNLGIGTTTPHASALLDVQSTSKGLLLPRMTTVQRLAIVNAATGLMVYDTDSSAFMQKNAGGWVKLQNSNDVLWWKNANNILNSNIGNVGIGTATPAAKLDVKSTTNYVAQFNGTSNMYMGIFENDVYRGYLGSFSGNPEDIDFGTGSTNATGKLHLTVQGNPMFTINATGQVGIGTTTPTAKLEVAGQVKITGGTPGAGKVLTSDANGLASWQTASGGSNNGWATTGNTNNIVGAFLGTNDKKPLIFKVNGTIAGKIDTTTDNTSFGIFTMPFTTGGLNSAFGAGALSSNNSGSWNTALGRNALYQNRTGASNTAVGAGSLESNKVGNNNVAVGVGTLLNSDAFNNNVAVGVRALTASHAHANTAVGFEAASGNISGVAVTALGNAALRNSTTNNNLTAIGDSALANNGIGASGAYYGENNTAIGAKAMKSNTIGWQNTVVGAGALQNSTTGTYNSALGVNALTTNTTGDGNTALGVYAMNFNTTGFYNTAVGTNALVFNQTGKHNVAIGNISMAYNTTGGFNIGIGDSSLSTNISGSNNTAIGNRANVGAENLTNATAIGANAVVNTSNSLVLGNNANVGIGTTSPTAKLEVAGQVKITGGTPGEGKVLTSDADGLASWQAASGGGGSSPWTAIGDDISNSNTGFVGIGNPSPSAKLDVKTSSNNVAKFSGSTYTYMSIYEDDIYRGYWGSYAGNPEDVDFGTGGGNGTGKLHLTIQGSPKFTINSNGEVGIGTTTPTTNLEVAGQVKITGGSPGVGKVLTSDANGLATWQTPAGGGGGGGSLTLPYTGIASTTTDAFTLLNSNSGATFSSFNTSTGAAAFISNGSSTAAKALIVADGYSGFGIQSPAAKVHINSTSTFSTPNLLINQQGGDNYGRMSFTQGNTNGKWTIASKLTGTPSNDVMNFNHSSGGDVLQITGDKKTIINGPLAPAGDAGTAGKVLQSTGTTTAPNWVSPTNSLYNNTFSIPIDQSNLYYNYGGGPGFYTAPEYRFSPVHSFSTTSNAKVMINAYFTVSGSVFGYIHLFVDGVKVANKDIYFIGSNGYNYTRSYIVQVGQGNHTIDFRVTGTSTNGNGYSTISVNSGDKSEFNGVVIPQ